MITVKPVLALPVLALVLAACSQAGPTAPPPAPSPPVSTAPPVLYSMTGTPAPADWEPRPVVVVKIDNTLAARPQVGVGEADLVIEEPVEGGLTRLAAFFESRMAPRVGPVRSIRASDVGLVMPASATVVASGGSPEGLAAYEKAGIPLVTEGERGLSRDPGRAAPYNVFADLSELGGSELGPKPSQPYFDFGVTKLAPGRKVTKVGIVFSPSRSEIWRWNSRGYWEQPDVPFRPRTLLALDVRSVDTGQRDAAGSPIPEIITSGQGSGYLFSEGQAHRILWQKRTPTSPFRFTTEAGLVVSVPPGRTWVSLIDRATGQVRVS